MHNTPVIPRPFPWVRRINKHLFEVKLGDRASRERPIVASHRRICASFQVFGEELERSLPCQLGTLTVIAGPVIAVEAVVGRVDEDA